MSGLTKAQFTRLRNILKKQGQWTASGILEEAAKKNSPLHALFTWDDSEAAHEYRLIEARRLKNLYNAQIVKEEEKVQHVPISVTEGSKEGSYMEIGAIVQQPDKFEAAMNEVITRLEAAKAAVDQLHDIAEEQEDDRAATLAALLRNLSVVTETVRQLH